MDQGTLVHVKEVAGLMVVTNSDDQHDVDLHPSQVTRPVAVAHLGPSAGGSMTDSKKITEVKKEVPNAVGKGKRGSIQTFGARMSLAHGLGPQGYVEF